MTYRHGLIVGKFYPPHRGHERLIRAAATQCTQVTVVVAGSSVESIPLHSRIEWLGWCVSDAPHVTVVGALDDHPIDYENDSIWRLHLEVFTKAASEVAPGVRIDAVFTGEEYGDEFARRLDAAHVRLDRVVDGLSATSIRSDLVGHWSDLVVSAREGLARRIVVLGAESTGTTTLARDLAGALGAGYVAEWGRTYSAGKLARARAASTSTSTSTSTSIAELQWTSEEFTSIAARQQAEIARGSHVHSIVIADTDALATSVWHERYVGGIHWAALELAYLDPPDLYVLTSEEGVLFHDDGLRDGEHVRTWMSKRFREVLSEIDVSWIEVTGDPEERVRQVLDAGRSAFTLPTLAPPLG